jgi:hypothetical protein
MSSAFAPHRPAKIGIYGAPFGTATDLESGDAPDPGWHARQCRR